MKLYMLFLLLILAPNSFAQPLPVTDAAVQEHPKTRLLLTDYLLRNEDATKAALQMIADAGTQDETGAVRPDTVVFDVEGNVILKSNLVIDKRIHVIVPAGTTVRQHPRSTFHAWYVSRTSGKRHTGMFLFRSGAKGSSMAVYGRLNAGAARNYNQVTRLTNNSIMSFGADGLTIRGDWESDDAVAAMWLIDSDSVRIEGRITVRGRTSWELGRGGSVLGLEGCYDLDASQATFRGFDNGEVVDLNAWNQRVVIGNVEAEFCDEAVDINESQHITIKSLRARNCSYVLSLYTNFGGHLTEKSRFHLKRVGNIRVEAAEIIYDRHLKKEILSPPVGAGGYSEGSSYRNFRFIVRGADPALLMAPLAHLGSTRGEVDVEVESDVAIAAAEVIRISGRGARVRVRGRIPLRSGSAMVRVQGRGHRIERPDLAQSGSEVEAAGRTGLDATLVERGVVVQPAIAEGHFAHPLLKAATTTIEESIVDVLSAGGLSSGAKVQPSITLKVYPNPSSSGATVDFALPDGGPVRLILFDLLGRRMAVLEDGERSAGEHSTWIDVTSVPAGEYALVLQAGALRLHQLITIVR